MRDPLDEATERIQKVFGGPLEREYAEWQSQVDIKLPLGAMVNTMARRQVWKDELILFNRAHSAKLEEEGYDPNNLTASWYVTRILVGPHPSLPQVKRVYLNAFGKL